MIFDIKTPSLIISIRMYTLFADRKLRVCTKIQFRWGVTAYRTVSYDAANLLVVTCVGWRHGELNYHLTHVFSGHGCFNAFCFSRLIKHLIQAAHIAKIRKMQQNTSYLVSLRGRNSELCLSARLETLVSITQWARCFIAMTFRRSLMNSSSALLRRKKMSAYIWLIPRSRLIQLQETGSRRAAE